jgi:hypothetical protein
MAYDTLGTSLRRKVLEAKRTPRIQTKGGPKSTKPHNRFFTCPQRVQLHRIHPRAPVPSGCASPKALMGCFLPCFAGKALFSTHLKATGFALFGLAVLSSLPCPARFCTLGLVDGVVIMPSMSQLVWYRQPRQVCKIARQA